MDLDDGELKATRQLYNKNVTKQRQIELAEFLEGLNKLTNKYKFDIGGCGCCGSPFITDLINDYCIGDCLFYDRKNKEYNITCEVEK